MPRSSCFCISIRRTKVRSSSLKFWRLASCSSYQLPLLNRYWSRISRWALLVITAWAVCQFHPGLTGTNSATAAAIPLRHGLQPAQRLSACVDEADFSTCLVMYLDLTGRKLWPPTNGFAAELDDAIGGR